MACGSSPGGGGIFFPFFGPLIISLRLGYVNAVSTSCWQTVSTSEVTTVLYLQFKSYSVVLKSQLINIIVISLTNYCVIAANPYTL